MKKLSFSGAEKNENKLLLVVDRQGIIGSAVLDWLTIHKNPVSVLFATASDSVSIREESTHTIVYKRLLPMFPNGEYVAVVLVYNGESELLEAVGSFIKKTDETKSRCVLVVPWEWKNNKEILKTIEKHTDLFVVFVGEIFGKQYRDAKTTIGRFFEEAQRNKQLVVVGMGITSAYPVFLEDVAQGVVQIAIENIKGKIFFLFPQFPPTKLGVARMFQKIDPLIKIDLAKEKEKEEDGLVLVDGIYFLPSSYMIEPKIREVYSTLGTGEEQIIKHPPVILEQREKGHFGKFVWFCILFTSCLLLMPLLTTILFSFVGVQTLKVGEEFLKINKIAQAQKKAEDASLLFTVALKTADALVYEASVIGMTPRATTVRNTVLTGKKASEALVAITGIANALTTGDGTKMTSSLRNALVLLDETSLEKNNSLFPQKTSQVKGLDLRGLTYVKNTADVLPEVLGYNATKTYLILLQNNMELRPGGGFIGSYAIAKVKDGKMVDFSINNVYDADGQLKGHVEPPFAIRRYLPSAHWYLRDSNYDIDFPKGASTSAFFLQKETGLGVDGVIGVDVSFVRSLVAVLGPVTIPDYNETITGDNFYTLVQKHAEENSFPGSTQKKDFLGAVFKALQNRIATGGFSYTTLLKVIQKGIDQKHLLFAFANPSIQNVFGVNGMSSSIGALEVHSVPIGLGESKVKDFLGISEANLGVNKANYQIARKVKEEVVISKEGSVSAKLTIRYNNTGKDDYKNYLRLIFPLGTKLSTISINGASQTIVPAVTDPKVYEAIRFVQPKGLEVESVQEGGKTVYGFLLVVPKEGSSSVGISYTLMHKFSSSATSLFYELWYFKQPGTDVYPYELSLSYPDTLKPLNVQSDGKADSNPLVFSQDLTTDTQYVIHFSRE